MSMHLSKVLQSAIADGGEDEAIAFGGRWRSWAWLGESVRAINDGVASANAVGLIARNRPQHIAAFAAGVIARRTTAMIYSAQTANGIAADIRRLNLEAIVADIQDWSAEAIAAAKATGTAAIAIEDTEQRVAVSVLAPRGEGPFRPMDSAISIELLSSGTTSAPKRIPLNWRTLEMIVAGAQTTYPGTGHTQAPQILTHPLGNVAGIAYVTPPLVNRQSLVLLEKFDANSWAQAVKTYQPARGSLPPAGVRMLLEANIAHEDLASLTLVAVGGGSLDSDLQDAFERRYGIPLLTAYGATEFGGVVANWTLESYRDWGKAKRGSAGRAIANADLRVMDQQTNLACGPGEIGLLEARVLRIGPNWIRTNDLASLDADGFLFIHGRADSAINRGGFKIVPDMIVSILKEYPGVADAAVVGIPDARLGEVPVAAIETRKGDHIDPDELRTWLKDRLVAYQVPIAIKVVDALPRNSSMKISQPDVKALFAP